MIKNLQIKKYRVHFMCFMIQRKRTNEHTLLPGLGNIRIRIGHVPSDAITPQPAALGGVVSSVKVEELS